LPLGAAMSHRPCRREDCGEVERRRLAWRLLRQMPEAKRVSRRSKRPHRQVEPAVARATG
jgi:hypothetical protein